MDWIWGWREVGRRNTAFAQYYEELLSLGGSWDDPSPWMVDILFLLSTPLLLQPDLHLVDSNNEALPLPRLLRKIFLMVSA
jgi:hypothetical protein